VKAARLLFSPHNQESAFLQGCLWVPKACTGMKNDLSQPWDSFLHTKKMWAEIQQCRLQDYFFQKDLTHFLKSSSKGVSNIGKLS
jgi:hypothetical protein